MDASELRSQIVGGWTLESFLVYDTVTEQTSQPFGRRPRGLIVYTDDGHMSAHLAPEGTGSEGHIAYSGTYSVQDHFVVYHDVMISTMPELLEQRQLRLASIDGDRLRLSATTDDFVDSALVWRRHQP